MKKFYLTISVIASILPWLTNAQSSSKSFKVPQVEIRDTNNKPMNIPKLGEKHLLIFYPDPDHASQNEKFTDYLEEHQINSDKIYSFGLVNLKDAPMMPNSIIRAVIKHKVKKTNALIFTDPDHKLRDAWRLGDVNDKFTVIFVTKDREIAFLRKGEMSKSDINEFYKVIEKYK